MIFMLVALIVLLAAIGAAVWLATDARRRQAPEPRVGAVDLFSGLVTLGLMALHLVAVVGRALSGKGFGGQARFAYRLPVLLTAPVGRGDHHPRSRVRDACSPPHGW